LSLKSFVDFGHDFDLYSFDPHIAVPAQVRVRDAAELADRAEFFVYERGFGKGSPAGFANLFRYYLLAERGGWWVDTDVVCLSDAIPDYPQFVARQVDGLVNNAVMRFERRHPVMLRCLELAAEKGRSVRICRRAARCFATWSNGIRSEDGTANTTKRNCRRRWNIIAGSWRGRPRRPRRTSARD
jgi:Glycosyltransferase sugar-binding region containing DXD motif